jgi:hypothetical protein
MVGIRKPDGGYGKALMHKSTKKLVSKLAPSGKESEYSGAPPRFKRMVKPPIRGQPTGFLVIVRMSSHLRALHSPLLVLATEVYVEAFERLMIVSPRVQ